MALKRYCDMCGIEIDMGRYLTIEIVANRIDLKGSMDERDLCEECAVSIRDAVLTWKEKE